MAQILDTQLAVGGAYILDTQQSGAAGSAVLSVSVSQANNTVAASASVVVTAYPAALSVSVSQANNTVAVAASVSVRSVISVVYAQADSVNTRKNGTVRSNINPAGFEVAYSWEPGEYGMPINGPVGSRVNPAGFEVPI